MRIPTDFTDPGGDYWAENGNRRARGIHVLVDDDPPGVQSLWLDDDGCKKITVDATITYGVVVRSEALVNGIDLLSYKIECDELDEDDECIGDKSESLVSYPTTVAVSEDAPEVVVSNTNQAWYNLVVGMRAFYRNDMNLGTYSSRGCCDDEDHEWYDQDGTCVRDSGEDTGVDPPDLYGEWDGSTEFLFFWEDWGGAGCCASQYIPTWESGFIPAVVSPKPWKYIIAHELGHVVVMERMGARTSETPHAENCGCMGAYTPWDFDSADPWANAADPDDDGKAELTMEYQSNAAREGWASFYSSWMWNSRLDSDCTYDTHIIHDFDMDGDIDNNYDTFGDWNEDDSYDGVYNCEGSAAIEDSRSGHSGPVPTGDSLESYFDGKDWLEDMVDEGLCGYDDGETGDTGNTCDPNTVLVNRSTQYDWHRFFWDMLTDEEIGPDKLADIYVDMCPTNWLAQDPDGGTDDDEYVIKRLEISATYHSEQSAWSTWKDNGQDH